MPKEARLKNKKVRFWQFTDFKQAKTIDDLKQDTRIQYVMWGKEVCPKTGRKHRQGWIAFKEPQRMEAVKEIMGSNLHLEVVRDVDDMEKYNRKDGDVIEYGKKPPGKGHRTDFDLINEIAKGGNNDMTSVIENFPSQYIRYHKGIEKLFKHYEQKIEFRHLDVTVLYGKTDTRKTHRAVCGRFNDCYVWKKSTYGETGWMDGYTNEDVLVIDEFSPAWMPFTVLLGLLDGHYCQQPVKGSFTQLKYTKVVITAQNHPKKWYDFSKLKIPKESQAAFYRRLTHIVEQVEPYECEHTMSRAEVTGNTMPSLPGFNPDKETSTSGKDIMCDDSASGIWVNE